MGILRIMSVGRSGVGKSTIGNLLLSGNPQHPFDTSPASVSCTQKPTTTMNDEGNCAFVDVPGIPDTDSTKTAEFYDMIIKEARKLLNVILFVFTYDRQDQDSFKLAEMLFHELNQSKVAKVLVINDKSNHKMGEPPTEADYEEQARVISNITKINFTHKIVVTADTMQEQLAQLKIVLSGTNSYRSKHLLSFSELSKHVDKLRKHKKYREKVIKTGTRRIKEIQSQLDSWDAGQPGRASISATFDSFFKFSRTKGKRTRPNKEEVRNITIALLKSEKESWEEKISELNLEQATHELENSCEMFHELQKALQVK